MKTTSTVGALQTDRIPEIAEPIVDEEVLLEVRMLNRFKVGGAYGTHPAIIWPSK